jgi:hypothetical protein
MGNGRRDGLYSAPISHLPFPISAVWLPGYDLCAEGWHHFGGSMAEIRVAPQRRNRAIVWIVVALVIVAAVVWYFLAGPGAAA